MQVCSCQRGLPSSKKNGNLPSTPDPCVRKTEFEGECVHYGGAHEWSGGPQPKLTNWDITTCEAPKVTLCSGGYLPRMMGFTLRNKTFPKREQ